MDVYGSGDADVNELGERGNMHGWNGYGGSTFTIHPEKQVSVAFTVSYYDFLNPANNPLSRRLANAVLACQAAAASGAKPQAMERK